MATVDVSPQSSRLRYGKLLDIRPFRAWLNALMDRQCAQGVSNPQAAVCALLEVDSKMLRSWLREGDRIDEAVVDRACSREGSIMVWELYESAAGEPVRAFTPAAIVTSCASPSCCEVSSGGRFCAVHAARLSLIREAYEEESRVLHSAGGGTRTKVKGVMVPTCCAPNCWAPRDSGEDFCESCQSDGYNAEDLD